MKKFLIALTCLMLLGCESSNQERVDALNEIIKKCPEGSTIIVEAYANSWNGGANITCKYNK